MTFKRFVTVIEIIAGVAALVFVFALFVNEPDDGDSAGGSGSAEPAGAVLYRASCATCHGQDGEGGVGPTLAGEVVASFPDAADEIAVVTDGRGGMPPFGGRLSKDEIAQIVEYTRTDLGG